METIAYQEESPGPLPEDRRHGTFSRVMDVILALDLAALAYLLGLQVYGFLFSDATQTVTSNAGQLLWLNFIVLLVLTGIIPLAWVAGTRREPIQGTLRYLHLHSFLPSAWMGLLLGIGLIFAAMLVGLLYFAIFGNPPSNPGLELILGFMTWPLAFFLAFSAGVGEEVLYRGILQKRLGVWGQSALFGLAHIFYGTVLQVAIPFLLALLFGYLLKRGYSLWLMIFAHFWFDFIVASSPLWQTWFTGS